MAQAKIDWAVLRGALSVFGICFLVSGIVLSASFYFRDEMNSQFQQHHTAFKSISRQYLSVDEEEDIIKSTYPRFVELYNRGIIGRENRLSWLETLKAAAQEVKIPELRYNIDTRKQYTPEFPLSTGPYQIYSTTMDLDLGLLHEGDFVTLVDRLSRDADGLFNVSKCSFRRLESVTTDADSSNIRAECALHWFTVNFPGDKEIVL